MWKYWLISVLIALSLSWGVMQYVGDGHVASVFRWCVIPIIAALVTAAGFKASAGKFFLVGLAFIALGGFGSEHWQLLVVLFLVGLGVFATSIAAWLVHHVKWFAA